VKQSVDVCEKKGVLGAGYIPKLHWTDALANSAGLFAYYRYAEASFILTCRHAGRHRIRLGRHDRTEDVQPIDAARDQRDRRRQSIEIAPPRALEPWQLHGDPRTSPAARFCR
jgi:hypothetical protein